MADRALPASRNESPSTPPSAAALPAPQRPPSEIISELARDPDLQAAGWEPARIRFSSTNSVRGGFLFRPNGSVLEELRALYSPQTRPSSETQLVVIVCSDSFDRHGASAWVGALGSRGAFTPIARVTEGARRALDALEKAFNYPSLANTPFAEPAIDHAALDVPGLLRMANGIGAGQWKSEVNLQEGYLRFEASRDGVHFEAQRELRVHVRELSFYDYAATITTHDGERRKAGTHDAQALFWRIARDRDDLPPLREDPSAAALKSLASSARSFLAHGSREQWHATAPHQSYFGEARGAFFAARYWPSSESWNDRVLYADLGVVATESGVEVGSFNERGNFIAVLKLETAEDLALARRRLGELGAA